MSNDYYLQQSGVKGMKWGVRRQRRTAAKRARRESVKREKKWLTEDYVNRGSLSDAELQRKVQRLRLENDYHRLSMEAKYLNRQRSKAVMKGFKDYSSMANDKNIQKLGEMATKEILKKKAVQTAALAVV